MIEVPIDGAAPLRPLVRSRLTVQYPNWAAVSKAFAISLVLALALISHQ